MAKVETGDFDGAVVAADNYLAVTPPSGERGQGLLTKSKALLGKKDFSGASAVAQEGLSFIKTGRLQAQLMMEEGDILMAEARSLMNNNDTAGAMQKFAAAAAKYIVPSQMFVDPEITPLALFHAIEALVSAGEKAKAEELVKQLKEKYPDFDAKKYIDQQQAKEGR
jgi:tetratricopeptide (TPR) repeat protein